MASALRPSRALFNEAKNYASPHQYHYVEGKTPFWRAFRNKFSVNPEISSGLPTPQDHRNPPPGNRPERAATTPSRASDIASNLYYNRDFRRKYQQLEMINQQTLTQLLLASPNEDGTKSLAAPGDESSTPSSGTMALTAPADLSSPSAFTNVLAQVHKQGNELSYSESKLPPTPPFQRPQHILKIQKDAIPHDKHAYFDVENYA
ncbi:hypothetical protein BDZ90DRAFT_250535, partial [Jaminaea rosea]